MKHLFTTLTDFEIAGLNEDICLADGHAYQDIHPAFIPIVETLPEIWKKVAEKPIPVMEKMFSETYSRFINSPILHDYPHFRICPTASNTIDIIGAILNHLKLNATLIEPTFDNLALLLKRRGVQLSSINDSILYSAAESNTLDQLFNEHDTMEVLFLVNPNNPTGLTLSETAFKNVIQFCQDRHILLIIDSCFRLYNRNGFDDYQLLINSSLSFIVFEDTGKVWPTQDLKASMVYFSADLANLFNEIYNEIYLCVSNFALGILCEFFERTMSHTLKNTIWDLVDQRRSLLQKAIGESKFIAQKVVKQTLLPVEWVKIIDSEKNDFDICFELQQQHLAILPGRQFYWNSSEQPHNHRYIRFSLMKKESAFLKGMNILADYCHNRPISLTTKQIESDLYA